MSLSITDLAKIANLSRLELNTEHAPELLGRINGFFELVAAMEAVDTTGVEPLSHPLSAVQEVALRLRPDVASEPTNQAARSANQQNAPAVEQGLFLVPKVIE